METIVGRFRNLIVLAAILFAQIVGLAVQVRRPAQAGETRLIRLWAVAAITPFEKAVVHTQGFFHDTWSNYLYLRGVRRENRELRAELDRMKLEQVRLAEDARMARRIQALLAFKEQHIDSTVAAQVIGTSGSDQSRVLYLDKGSRDGIKVDMAVITPTGIVGKVVQVFADSAQVLPINDQLSGVGVALKTTRLQGILRGANNGGTTIQYIMADERVEPGEEVITSGGDRIFPKGLPVGKVVEVKPGKDLFLNIRVEPSAQIDRLEDVLVVTKVVEKPPDTKDLGPIRASDILAERLPGVPNKAQFDAYGNAIVPPAGAAGAAGVATPKTGKPATPPAGATASRASTSGATAGPTPRASTAQPATGATATASPTGARSTGGASANRSATAGTTGTPTPRRPAATANSAATSGDAAVPQRKSAASATATDDNSANNASPKPGRKPPAEGAPSNSTTQPKPAPPVENPQR